MLHFWKTLTTILVVVLLANALTACRPLTPVASPLPDSASPIPTQPFRAGRIGFHSDKLDHNGKVTVSIINADGSSLLPLAAGMYPYWSPDGQYIAYNSSDSLMLMKADGSEQRPLARITYATFPLAWSPDGRQIAFATRSGDFAGSIYIVDVNMALSGDIKGSLKPVVEQAVDAYDLAWSPDGRQLLFSYHESDDSPNLIVTLPAGETVKTVVELTKLKVLAEGWQPTW